ncbi:MAG: transketolase family protein [Candidatus Micrarchaeota archaeon]|nr:transketolase family protein [Candidatus Micrarchaeota archaeon]
MKLNPDMHLLDPLSPDLKKAATRNGFGAALAEIGAQDETVVALSADVSGSVQMSEFAKKFPGRFIQVGVAEQNMAAVAAGLAYSGKKPYIGAFAVFSPGRNWEQIRTTICYANANVKIEGSHVGLDVGEDGATHQALEDVSLMRTLPNMTVISPCDFEEAKKAVYAAWKSPGPFYIRCTRNATPTFTTAETPFDVGKMNLLCDGADIAVVAAGRLVFDALLAADALSREGISAAVANMHTISSPDASLLEKLARKCGSMITVEDHQVKGGLGSAVCEALADAYPARVRRMGMEMKFGESGKGSEVMRKYGLDKDGIIKAAKEEMGRKKQ